VSYPALNEQELLLRDRLRAHVAMLGGVIGERHIYRPAALDRTRDYVREQLVSLGYAVHAQEYLVSGQRVGNVIAEHIGGSLRNEIIVVGAHYDSVPGCPAANDNGSGVAAMLELARALRDGQLSRTVRFAGFVNEEPPFFQGEQMGSLVYARACREQNDNIVGMLSLETIGCYSDEKGSQSYPLPVQLLFPAIGNFIAFVSDLSSRSFLKQVVKAFEAGSRFSQQHAALPRAIPGIGWSDHWSFWQAGYPALMVTDTAPYRYPHYHRPTDTPDKLHYDHMTRVVWGLVGAVQSLAQ
jgi:Zn-dependent M28 family amino/carboxypeptidase